MEQGGFFIPPSIMTGNPPTSHHSAPAPLSTPQQADIDGPRRPVAVYSSDQPPESHALHVPPYGVPVPWGAQYEVPVSWSPYYGFPGPWNGFLYPDSTGMVSLSSGGLQTRNTSQYDLASSATDNKKNPGHSLPVQRDNGSIQDGKSPEHYGAGPSPTMAHPNAQPQDTNAHHVPQRSYPTTWGGGMNSSAYSERVSTPPLPSPGRLQENVSQYDPAHGASGNKKGLEPGMPAPWSQDSMFPQGYPTLDHARSVAMHASAYPDRYPRHGPQHEGSAALGRGRNSLAHSKTTSSSSSRGTSEWREALPNGLAYSAAANGEVSENTETPFQSHLAEDAKIKYIGNKLKNVILFGETGVGKSSVLNLMAGSEIAQTSGHLQGCTLQSTEYWFAHSEEISLRIFDTVGLEEPEMGINSFMGAIEKAHQLVKALHDGGGVDLLLFCIKGGRITAAMQRSYRLFYEVLCGSQVPLAIVVTNLEHEDVMEDWWVKNEAVLQGYGIHSVAHTCITAVSTQVRPYAQKRAESQMALRNMLHDAVTKPSPTYMRDVKSWFTTVAQLLRSYVTKKEVLQKKGLIKILETRCSLSRNDAEKLAQILLKKG